jgi:hypothetical protein
MKPEITDIKEILSKKEFDRFGRFISSPFFNIEERFMKVYKIVKDDSSSREDIAKKIFGENASSGELRFRKLISEFMKIFNRFLSELEFEKDDYRQRLMLINQLATRNLNDSYMRAAKRAELSIQTQGIKDEAYYLKMLELYSLRYQIEGFNYNSWEEDLSFKVSDYIEKYFAEMKLFLYQRLQSIEYIFHPKNKIKKKYLDEVCSYARFHSKELTLEYSDIYLRYLMYNMIQTPEKKELLDEYLSILAYYEKNPNINCRIYYEDLMNYYTLLVNSGMKNFEIDIVRTAKIMEKKKYFTNAIEVSVYKNIIEAAIGLGEYNWGEEFGERNSIFIEDKYRESISALCLGKINFFKKDYDTARKFLSMVVYDDYWRYSEAKLIECRMLYEEKKIPELFMVMQTAGKYLKTHTEIGTNLKSIYSAFLNCLRILINIYEKSQLNINSAFDIQKLEKEISEAQILIYGETWLKEKIEELKKAG